ncbi:Zinc finger CCCH domain-containing protein 62 [Platanthera zijinensis]|uniref:Zinc finger CCCH domain-containing protein 62 n=1 Tax=Platanthera zijinensis TaxID=2320716 RepID=A0AAP0BJN6_9ASPA
MAAAGSMLKGREAVFSVSSSDEESDSWVGQGDEEDDDDDDGEGEEEYSQSEDEDYEDEESESDQEVSTDSDESSDEDEEYESVSDDQSNEDDDNNACDPKEAKPTDDKLSDKVTDLLRQRFKKLDALKLEECKAYLRKHELMISGTKAECIQRILEHWRLKDGNGDRLYPKSTFTINCTGDVCKGDVVMFKQRVYEKFDKMSRSGKVLGKRTVVGRVVKESYGVAKQQHTFTVEVLWSKGVKPLPPLYPLLVKGRNLYRFRTFRQGWHNEAERCKVLEEKHRRGATARYTRASNQTRNCVGSKRQKKPSNSTKQPSKRLKNSEATPRKKQKEISNSKTRINNLSSKKHVAAASSSRHSKKRGTKASSVSQSKKSKTKTSSSTHRRQVNHCVNEVDPHHISVPRPPLGHIYGDPHAQSHRRNNIAVASQTGREMFHIPSHNYDHNAGRVVPLMREPHRPQHHQSINEGANYFARPQFFHPSQFDPSGHLSHPYSSSFVQYGSGSSGHSFTPAAYDDKFSSFHFRRGRET